MPKPLNLSFRTASQGSGSAGTGPKPEFWGSQDDVALSMLLGWSGVVAPRLPEAGSEWRGGEVLAADGEGSLQPLCGRSPWTPLSLNPPRWAGRLQLHRLQNARRTEAQRHQMREKWFSCEAKVFCFK